MEKTKHNYVVVYLSSGGMHERFRCKAVNSAQARKKCRQWLGVEREDITDVYREEY